MPDPGFGLYIHWPFCQAKCPYCDFNSHVWTDVDQDDWTKAYLREIDRIASETGDGLLRSVFFGGGTPSLMEGRTVERILDRVRRNWRMTNDVEITLEANPTSVEAGRFSAYRQAGVNRVSLGLQALNDEDLRRLGRLHSAAEGLAALDVARNVFDRVSFDLIYARQDQSVSAWQSELDRALSFDPDHLSLYQLTIEAGTAFGDRLNRGKLAGLPDEDRGASLWDVTQEATDKAGLPAYEVSNHAKPGEESRHNLIYWQGGDYAGIGPGAHGRLTLDGRRWATVSASHPRVWLQASRNGSAEDRSILSDSEIFQEKLLMGLRLSDGVVLSSQEEQHLLSNISYLGEIGLVSLDQGRLHLTRAGRPLLNAVLDRLLNG
ncbi:radical SAM family heme chaperone HemW [Salibaculum halophilum]|uniref:radical SAM family heme chaperone HemW n=1 Tax=Salibaculum halophilum TaxID=1914408 RepID=UPI000A0F78F2|nr:radical SAM family heme chaperone HemW [Salibaculum halophilum]